MKKIRLDADALEVLSFATDPQPEVRGTVNAAGSGYTCYCPMEPYTAAIECRQLSEYTCPGWPGC